MASKHCIDQLESMVAEINSIDEERVMRPDLGKFSLKWKDKGYLEKLKKSCSYYLKYAKNVHDDDVEGVVKQLKWHLDMLLILQRADNKDYVANYDEVYEGLMKAKEQLIKYTPSFFTAEVKAKGILDNDEIENRYNMMIKILNEKSKEAEEKSKEAEEKMQKAERIEIRARGEAVEVSAEKAIGQFKEEEEHLKKAARYWLGGSVFVIVVLVVVVVYFLSDRNPEQLFNQDTFWAVGVYYTTIRITLLGIISAVATFCLRIYRSQLHMTRHNSHRKRIANSMQSFVDSATTKDHRDKILSILVEEVATFGSSGLIRDKDDHMTSSRMIVDQFTKTISPGSGN